MPDRDLYDVPDLPIAWTVNGTDQSDLVLCKCGEVFHEEMMDAHLRLTHGVIPDTRYPGHDDR